MKRYLIIILAFVLLLTGCSSNNKNNKDKDGFLIGTSNDVNNDNLQIKVIIDSINIRKESDPNSDKLGIVKKDSIFDVIEYKADNRFIWFKIKTNNNIEGYVASDINEPYVEINKEIDYIYPTIKLKKTTIEVDKRENIAEKLKENCEYSDDKDPNPKFEYNIINNQSNDNYLTVEISVTDSFNNKITETVGVKVTGEKVMKDGTWLSYQELLKKQQTAKSLCSKYGMSAWRDEVGCTSSDNSLNLFISTSTARIGYYQPYTYCQYDINLNPYLCEDAHGNEVSHDLISSNLKNLETKWLKIFKNYNDDVKKTTGYDLNELRWID